MNYSSNHSLVRKYHSTKEAQDLCIGAYFQKIKKIHLQIELS